MDRLPRNHQPEWPLSNNSTNNSRLVDANQQLDRRIEHALTFLQKNYRQELGISEIAGRLHLSNSHFRHLFKNQTGMSPSRYVKVLRLQRAKELLESTFLSVKEVMSEAGFSDLSHFVRDYKSQYGQSPLQTRTSTNRQFKNTQPAVRNFR
jgi:AraC family transcriptional regulator, transcriptional activator for feuABC-ybbA operon